MNIEIRIGQLTIPAVLNNSKTAEAIFGLLPFKTGFNTWGDEIYFSIPVHCELDETAREEVELGDLGYWPEGDCFCIFFGPTPMSTPGKIIPASAVNIIGKVSQSPEVFKKVMNAQEIELIPVDQTE